MKSVSLIPFAALASAFVIVDPAVLNSIPLEKKIPSEDPSWKEWLPSKDAITSSVGDAVDSLSSGIENAIHSVEGKVGELEDNLAHIFDDEHDGGEYGVFDIAEDRPHHGHGHGHGKPNQTIYELISKSKYTTKFAKLVDEYSDIVDILNSTEANYTLFVPIDSAFEHLPKDKKPSKEFVEDLLKYHIGLGLYPAGRVLVTHTLPTALDEPLLGDKPQRLRTSVGVLSGVRVNFYSKVVAVDIPATNGFIHAVKSILVPPPYVGKLVSLFPGKFSTLLLAYDKTDFTSFIHSVKLEGSTVFAPTNHAFALLGTPANAFLFNTEKGLKYLKAILKYHIVANETVYSDAYYSTGDQVAEAAGGHYTLDLPTLLGDKHVSVDISRFLGHINVKVNGYVPVVVQDALAKNGVVQVVGRVIIPPHPHKDAAETEDVGEISVEDLIERLAPYVDEKTDGETELEL